MPAPHILRDMTVLMFALTGGLTLSGIIANIYRMLARHGWRKLAADAAAPQAEPAPLSNGKRGAATHWHKP